MPRFYGGYCGYCSIEAVDTRPLKEDKTADGGIIIECLECGGESKLVPIEPDSSYRKIVRCNNVQRKK